MNQMSISEKITYSTVKITCKYANGTQGSGTGFIMSLCQDEKRDICYPVIITNNHVVKDSIETAFEFCKADGNGMPIDTEPFNITIVNGNAWRHHPDRHMDLCFLPLKTIFDQVNSLNGHIYFTPLTSDLIADDAYLATLNAIEDVVMVGYPQGLMDTYNHKPIIRRGITATHPRNDYMGKPDILLDIAAYPGSSGSPVFLLNEGAYLTGNTIQLGSRIKLLGVLYSGPQYTVAGTLAFANIPVLPTPVMSIPNNLGVIIKAKTILDIEDYLENTVLVAEE